MKEVWKDIEGYEGLYQVSNYGRVKSLARTKMNHGKSQLIPERIMSQEKNSSGYLRVNLYKNSDRKRMLVHRLVAHAFISNPENKPCIDHIDTDKTNNHADNLRWCTQKENCDNPITNERLKKTYAKAHECSKKKVLCITTGKMFDSLREASNYYNCNLSGNMNKIVSGNRKYCGKLPDGTPLEWKYI